MSIWHKQPLEGKLHEIGSLKKRKKCRQFEANKHDGTKCDISSIFLISLHWSCFQFCVCDFIFTINRWSLVQYNAVWLSSERVSYFSTQIVYKISLKFIFKRFIVVVVFVQCALLYHRHALIKIFNWLNITNQMFDQMVKQLFTWISSLFIHAMFILFVSIRCVAFKFVSLNALNVSLVSYAMDDKYCYCWTELTVVCFH